MSTQPAGTRTGTVVEFDESVGLGAITETDGMAPVSSSHDTGAPEVIGAPPGEGVRHEFHCTAIADGTRTIAVGAEVVFRRAPGRGGRFEATDIVGR